MKTTLFYTLLGAASTAFGHMELTEPAPLRSKNNPNAGTDVDYNMMAPVTADNFPCRGSLGLLGTPAGAPVAEYQPGQSYSATVGGGANHNGGSCQFSLSYDGGSTWTVIQSIIGDCPKSGTGSYPFTIPADAPSGEAVFSWSWVNQVGNRELYQNCAVVTIGGGGSTRRQASIPFSERPQMFVANVGGSCGTAEGIDTMYPDAGPDVVVNSQNTGPPVGDCGASGPAPVPVPGGGNDGGNDGDDGGEEVALPIEDTPAPTPTDSESPADSPTAAPDDSSATLSVPPPPAPTTPPAEEDDDSCEDDDSPGDVFLTVPNDSAPSPTDSAPTTLITATRPGTDAPEATYAPEVPDNTGGEGQQSGPCSNEGAWNCIGGTAFQRCASGAWSPIINMAAGTSCTPGISDELSMGAAKKFRFRRH